MQGDRILKDASLDHGHIAWCTCCPTENIVWWRGCSCSQTFIFPLPTKLSTTQVGFSETTAPCQPSVHPHLSGCVSVTSVRMLYEEEDGHPTGRTGIPLPPHSRRTTACLTLSWVTCVTVLVNLNSFWRWGTHMVNWNSWACQCLNEGSSLANDLKIFFYFTLLVLLYINMNLPRLYTCSPSWTPLPPPSLCRLPEECYGEGGGTPYKPFVCMTPYKPQASCILHQTWTGDSFLIWYCTCFNAILPKHPTLSLSHRLQKTVLYICVSFAVSHTGLSLPSF